MTDKKRIPYEEYMRRVRGLHSGFRPKTDGFFKEMEEPEEEDEEDEDILEEEKDDYDY